MRRSARSKVNQEGVARAVRAHLHSDKKWGSLMQMRKSWSEGGEEKRIYSVLTTLTMGQEATDSDFAAACRELDKLMCRGTVRQNRAVQLAMKPWLS